MASRLTVIFYIILCLEAGLVLTVVPWMQVFGMGDWGNNYLLLYASQKIGLQGLQQAVGSGWVRGAVTGLGLLNLAMAFWEMSHFGETVRKLQGADASTPASPPEASTAATPPSENALPTDASDDARAAANTVRLSDHARRDDARHHPGE